MLHLSEQQMTMTVMQAFCFDASAVCISGIRMCVRQKISGDLRAAVLMIKHRYTCFPTTMRTTHVYCHCCSLV